MQKRFHSAVRGSTDGLWDWDTQTNVLWYAPRFKELLGYHEDEFPNQYQSWESHLHPDDRDRDSMPYTVIWRTASATTWSIACERKMESIDGSGPEESLNEMPLEKPFAWRDQSRMSTIARSPRHN